MCNRGQRALGEAQKPAIQMSSIRVLPGRGWQRDQRANEGTRAEGAQVITPKCRRACVSVFLASTGSS